MLVTVFLLIMPLACACMLILNVVSATLWHTLAKASYSSKRGAAVISIAYKAMQASIITIVLFVLTLAPSSIISNLAKVQLAIVCIGMLSCYLLIGGTQANIDHIVFLGFSALTSALLIISYDLIVVFFALELLNMLIIYSFFLNALSSKQLSHNSSLKISTSCVYQFILNFFSSIVLYLAINSYISLTGGSALSGLGLLVSNSSPLASTSIILSAFLLKFGSGPWIFFKVNIYRNLSFVAVFMYTTIYMLAVFTVFLNFIFVYGLALNAVAKQALCLLASTCSLIFASIAFQSPNFFVFLSFSSLINITIFLLMVVSL